MQGPENHTLLSGKYPFRPNEGVPPSPQNFSSQFHRTSRTSQHKLTIFAFELNFKTVRLAQLKLETESVQASCDSEALSKLPKQKTWKKFSSVANHNLRSGVLFCFCARAKKK